MSISEDKDEEVIKNSTGSAEPLINENKNYKKKILIISIIIILILIVIFLILFFTVFSKDTNFIKATYFIENPTNETKIFDSSYIDLIKSLKIEGKSVEINNIQPFEKAGNFNIEIYFKNELKLLDNLFLQSIIY